jgi:Concanavalin A-like lectin/glucanases superfamily/Immunoglobulin domain
MKQIPYRDMNSNVTNRLINHGRRLLSVALVGLAVFSWVALARAQSVQDGSITITRTASTNFTTSFTVTAGAKVLVFTAAAHSSAAMVFPSLSWGAQPMTLAVTTNAGSSYTGVAIYYLFNPTPGTQTIAGTVTNGTVDNTFFQVYTLNGIDTTFTPLTGQAATNGTGPIGDSVAGVPINGLAVVAIGNGTTAATTLLVSPPATINTVNNTADGGRNIIMGYAAGLTAGTDTFTNNLAANNKLTLAEVVFGTLPSPPIITAQPQSLVVFPGLTVSLKVNAIGTVPLAYQWQRNGTNLINSAGYISGSLSNILTITGVSAVDAVANYQVVITNTLGSASSSFVGISIQTPNAYETTALTNNPFVFYTFSETNNPQTGNVTAFDSIGSFNGTYGTGGAADNSGSGAFIVAGPRATADGLIGFPDTNTALGTQEGNTPADSYVTMPAFNLNKGAGTNVLTITAWINPNGEQIPAAGIVFSRSGTTVAGLNFTSMTNSDTYSLGTLAYTWNNNQATYGWNSGLTPPLGMWSLISLVITPTNATIYMLNANGLTFSVNNVTNAPQIFEGPTLIGQDNNAANRGFNGSIDEVALFSQALTQNQLISLFAAGSGSTLVSPQPSIITEPTFTPSQIFAGFTVSATVLAINTTSYQWMAGAIGSGVYTNLTNGTNISGSTGPTLTISNVQPANALDYVVTATSVLGSVTSSPPATLTFTAPGSPTNFTLNFGGTPIFQGAGADWNTVNDWNPYGYSISNSLIANPGSSFEIVPGASLRTPTTLASNLFYVFPGPQLTVDGNGVFIDNAAAGETTMGQLKIKAPGTLQAMTNYYPLLVMAGGQLDNGGSGSGVPQVIAVIQGTVNVISNTPIYAESAGITNRPFQIDAFLTGNGSIEYHDCPTTNDTLFGGLNITGTANTYSGTWNVVQGPLIGSGINSLGTNTITIGTNGVLETSYPIHNTSASLILNGRMFLTQNDTFNSVVINGTNLPPGIYSAAQLNATNATAFPSTFVALFGTTATVASGQINVGNVVGPPPTPHITHISLSGTTLSISATNGALGGTWALLQSTNVALPLSQWQTNITGTFDGSGNLSTNILNTATNLQEFYILKQ